MELIEIHFVIDCHTVYYEKGKCFFYTVRILVMNTLLYLLENESLFVEYLTIVTVDAFRMGNTGKTPCVYQFGVRKAKPLST